MNDSVLKAQIDAAKAYEALFVPALFGQWAAKVADTAQIKSGQRVLEVALLERLAGTQAADACVHHSCLAIGRLWPHYLPIRVYLKSTLQHTRGRHNSPASQQWSTRI
jgi:hypothetical protein